MLQCHEGHSSICIVINCKQVNAKDAVLFSMTLAESANSALD